MSFLHILSDDFKVVTIEERARERDGETERKGEGGEEQGMRMVEAKKARSQLGLGIISAKELWVWLLAADWRQALS